MTKPEGATNGTHKAEVVGSTLSQASIAILLSLTPSELRALNQAARNGDFFFGIF